MVSSVPLVAKVGAFYPISKKFSSSALSGVEAGFYLKSLVQAVLLTILIGAVLGAAVVYLTVSRRINQVVAGLLSSMASLAAMDAIFSMMFETKPSLVAAFLVIFPKAMQKIPVPGLLPFAQPVSAVIPCQFLQMLPYAVTIVALPIMVKHLRIPKTWDTAYDPRDV